MIECRLCTLVFNSDLLSPIIMIILARHYNMIEILKISIQYDKLSTPHCVAGQWNYKSETKIKDRDVNFQKLTFFATF